MGGADQHLPDFIEGLQHVGMFVQVALRVAILHVAQVLVLHGEVLRRVRAQCVEGRHHVVRGCAQQARDERVQLFVVAVKGSSPSLSSDLSIA